MHTERTSAERLNCAALSFSLANVFQALTADVPEEEDANDRAASDHFKDLSRSI